MGQPTDDSGQPAFRRQHGALLQVATSRGKKIPIPCPRCRRRTHDRYWHTRLEQGICERCWGELHEKQTPMAMRP